MPRNVSRRLLTLSTILILVSALAIVVINQPEPPTLDVPYVETPDSVVQAMLDLAEVTAKDKVYDLGSGDGRIPIAAGQRGAKSVGVELDPDLVRKSRQTVKDLGLQELVRIDEDDVFKADLTSADVVFLYLSPRLNRELKPKLLSELSPGSRVVSHLFAIDGWLPEDIIIVEGRRLFLWRIPESTPAKQED